MDRALAGRHPLTWTQRAGRVVLPLSFVAMLAGSLAPSSVLGWLRTVVPGFATGWDWLDASLPCLNPLHVMVYAWVALLWRLLVPRGSAWRVPVVLVAIGATCEWLQFFVPTREPRLTDVLSDAIGVAIGWGLALVVNRVVRRKG